MSTYRVSIAIVGFSFCLGLVAHSQAPRPGQPATTAAAGQPERRVERTAKVLTQLPAGIEGVEIRDGAVRVKSGYEFVQNRRTRRVSVRRIGGRGLGGDWSCNCSGGSGTCQATVTTGTLVCTIPAGSKCTQCDLTITTTGLRGTALIRY